MNDIQDGPMRSSMTADSADSLYDELARSDWDYADSVQDQLHAVHPYPAKFIPEIPRALIRSLTRPGDLVLDQFSGGGTTAVEALRAGRRFIGIDANPLATHITRVKISKFSAEHQSLLTDLLIRCSEVLPENSEPEWLPAIPNVERWYDANVFAMLGRLRDLIVRTTTAQPRDLAMLLFANIAAKASYQESETRYVSKPRNISTDDVLEQFVRELGRSMQALSRADWNNSQAEVQLGDARDESLYPSGVTAAITSPPYPNAFDYHLYHRFRLFWLGDGPQELRRVEIGSHLKHQAERAPAASYLADMRQVLTNTLHALVPGGWFALVVGDGIYKQVLFKTAQELSTVAADVGYEVRPPIDRRLPTHRRSITSAGRRLQVEQILLLRKPYKAPSFIVTAPDYALYPYERVLRQRELVGLGAALVTEQPADSDDLQVEAPAAAADGLRDLAFSRTVALLGGDPTKTVSALLEGDRVRRRKNSTYLSHGLHSYKGKFYPQLAKALINASGIRPGGYVLDPFGGSGTVALEATLSGRNAISMDCNPVADATARAKTDLIHIGSAEVRKFLTGLAGISMPKPERPVALTAFSPEVLDELTSWFPAAVLVKLNHALNHVRSAEDARLVNLGHVLVSDIIREVSQQEPKDLRIRRRADPIHDAPVLELLAQRARSLLDRYIAYLVDARPTLRQPGSARVILGDSTRSEEFSDIRADALVSSPPYAAALPYIDTDRLSIAAIFGGAGKDRRVMEATMVGSRDISTTARRKYEASIDIADDTSLPASTMTWLAAYLDAVREDPKAGFRRRQAPAILLRYFRNMSKVLTNVQRALPPGASVWLVLGDSKSTIGGRPWVIPTVQEVLTIAKHLGFTWIESIPITVTREDRLHSRHAIVENQIVHLEAGHSQP